MDMIECFTTPDITKQNFCFVKSGAVKERKANFLKFHWNSYNFDLMISYNQHYEAKLLLRKVRGSKGERRFDFWNLIKMDMNPMVYEAKAKATVRIQLRLKWMGYLGCLCCYLFVNFTAVDLIQLLLVSVVPLTRAIHPIVTYFRSYTILVGRLVILDWIFQNSSLLGYWHNLTFIKIF